MQRLGQSNKAFLNWPWRAFFLYVLGLGVSGVGFGAGVSAWMAHAGRVVETEVTARFDLAVGLGVAVLLLSIVVALRYWKRPPFLWACFVIGTLLCGRPAFGGGFVAEAAVFMLILSKMRAVALYWFRS